MTEKAIVGYEVYYPGQINATNGYWEKKMIYPVGYEQPLVSAVMVTRGNVEFVTRSIQSFKKQDWNNKELVIVCDDVSDDLKKLIGKEEDNIKLVESPKELTLGDYRNISIANSQGDYICQWDDDDYYSPHRISAGMRALAETNSDVTFLQRWWVWWKDRSVLFLSNARIWEGSMIAKRSVIPIYPSQKMREDSVMVDHMLKHTKTVVIDFPNLYCYSITGNNTWGDGHFDSMMKGSTSVYKDEAYDRKMGILNNIFDFS